MPQESSFSSHNNQTHFWLHCLHTHLSGNPKSCGDGKQPLLVSHHRPYLPHFHYYDRAVHVADGKPGIYFAWPNRTINHELSSSRHQCINEWQTLIFLASCINSSTAVFLIIIITHAANHPVLIITCTCHDERGELSSVSRNRLNDCCDKLRLELEEVNPQSVTST